MLAKRDSDLQKTLNQIPGIEYAAVTVSNREMKGSHCPNVEIVRITENGVWRESSWGNFLWAGEESSKI